MMNRPIRILLLGAFQILISLFTHLHAQTNQILMFVSHEDTYYSEYIVMRQALEASGYTVDVRSASTADATSYMVPAMTDIEETANTLAGSSYADFTSQFLSTTGTAWNSGLNAIQSSLPVDGSILTVSNISAYDAIVIPGGTGAQDYRVDGSYTSQGAGGRLISAAIVQEVAEKLNSLALEALANDKPVLAQCHGAGLPVYWRIPETSGPAAEAIGYSLLKDGFATGYPEAATATNLADLDVGHKIDDRVTVSSPHSSAAFGNNGRYKIITSRDWYPQTVLYAANTLLNILRSYPSVSYHSVNAQILILHGGAVNEGNCLASNQSNDVPCNYGGGADLPADYTDLVSLFSSDSPNDAYNFTVTDLNLFGALPFDANSQASVLNYFSSFHTILFYKHWSNSLTTSIQQAMVSFADQGGGVMALHHGLYNDHYYGSGKDVLASDLFLAESHSSTWSATRTTYSIFNTNYGHFISTYGMDYATAGATPTSWSGNSPIANSNLSFSTYPSISLFDEIYNNMTFINSPTFGHGTNEITPLFSNDLTPTVQSHVSGFCRLFDPSEDGSVGRVAYMQPGETQANYVATSRYGQLIRNAAFWASENGLNTVLLPVEMLSFYGVSDGKSITLRWSTATEIENAHFAIYRKEGNDWVKIGQLPGAGTTIQLQNYSFTDYQPLHGENFYQLVQYDYDGTQEPSKTIRVQHHAESSRITIYPNPAKNIFRIAGVPDNSILQLFNASGKVIKTINLQVEIVEISGLESGIYFLKILGNDQPIHKVIIQ